MSISFAKIKFQKIWWEGNAEKDFYSEVGSIPKISY